MWDGGPWKVCEPVEPFGVTGLKRDLMLWYSLQGLQQTSFSFAPKSTLHWLADILRLIACFCQYVSVRMDTCILMLQPPLWCIDDSRFMYISVWCIHEHGEQTRYVTGFWCAWPGFTSVHFIKPPHNPAWGHFQCGKGGKSEKCEGWRHEVSWRSELKNWRLVCYQ